MKKLKVFRSTYEQNNNNKYGKNYNLRYNDNTELVRGKSGLQQVDYNANASHALVKPEQPLSPKKMLRSNMSMLPQHVRAVQANIANIYKTMAQKDINKKDFQAALHTLRLLLGSAHAPELQYNAEIACDKLMEMFVRNHDLQQKVSELQLQLDKKAFRLETLQRQYDVTKLNFEDHLESARLDTIKQQDPLEARLHLKEKVRQLQDQLTELRNKHATVIAKMEHAELALKQEIGPDFNLNDWIMKSDEVAAKDARAWRGRAAEVQRLKQEETRLLERCRQIQKANATAQLHAVSILKAEKEVTEKYRDKAEELQRENTTLQTQVRHANSKVAKLKAQLKIMADREQRVMLPKAIRERTLSQHERSDLESQLTKLENEKSKAKYGERKKQDKIKAQRKQLEENENELQDMRIRLFRAEEDLKAITGGFLFSCRNIKYQEFMALLKGLDNQNRDIVKYSRILKERLSAERHKNQELLQQLSMQSKRLKSFQDKAEELQQENCEQHMTNATNGKNMPIMGKHISRLEQQAVTAEKYRHAYELSQEQIRILQDRIHFLQIEKEMDAKAYECSVLNSKNVLLEVIKNQKHMPPSITSQPHDYTENFEIVNYATDSKV